MIPGLSRTTASHHFSGLSDLWPAEAKGSDHGDQLH
jgi:hypothetical protein